MISEKITTSLYYFSGTGNSLFVAKSLHHKLEHCEMIPIASVFTQNSINTTSDKVGFIFPVYCRGMPQIVYNFIKKLNFVHVKYIFAVATKGTGFPQNIKGVLNALLKSKKQEFDFAYELRVFSNNIIGTALFNPLPSIKKINRRIYQSELELAKIAVEIRNNQVNRTNKSHKISGEYNLFLEEVNNIDKKYYSDEKCNGCGICEKICPVNNIELVNKKPTWQHNCQQCLACIHYCPQKAIQYGKFTINRRRYHHPFISLKELINQKTNKEIFEFKMENFHKITEINTNWLKLFFKSIKLLWYRIIKRKWYFPDTPEITVDQLYQRIRSNNDLLLLDIRDCSEFYGLDGAFRKYGHIPNAQLIPISQLKSRLIDLKAYREREIVIICPGGGMSLIAVKILTEAGFTNVKSLSGGMDLWNKQGYPTTTAEEFLA